MATGTAIIDFGAAPGADSASVTITGQTSILATSLTGAWPIAVATADHSVDEVIMAGIVATCSPATEGTGFTITATSALGIITGKFMLAWAWT